MGKALTDSPRSWDQARGRSLPGGHLFTPREPVPSLQAPYPPLWPQHSVLGTSLPPPDILP